MASRTMRDSTWRRVRGRERGGAAAATHGKRCEVEVDAAACREVNAGSGGIMKQEETNEGAHGCWRRAGWSS
jgi:hypothetical protein